VGNYTVPPLPEATVRVHLVFDGTLLAKAMRLGGHRTKRLAVETALREHVQRVRDRRATGWAHRTSKSPHDGVPPVRGSSRSASRRLGLPPICWADPS